MKNINIEELDTSRIEVPEGYKVIVDPEYIERQRVEQEILALEERIAITPIPTDEELIAYAKLTHPYYEDINRLNSLR